MFSAYWDEYSSTFEDFFYNSLISNQNYLDSIS
jgi:hypothetical protein